MLPGGSPRLGSATGSTGSASTAWGSRPPPCACAAAAAAAGDAVPGEASPCAGATGTGAAAAGAVVAPAAGAGAAAAGADVSPCPTGAVGVEPGVTAAGACFWAAALSTALTARLRSALLRPSFARLKISAGPLGGRCGAGSCACTACEPDQWSKPAVAPSASKSTAANSPVLRVRCLRELTCSSPLRQAARTDVRARVPTPARPSRGAREGPRPARAARAWRACGTRLADV